MSINVDGAARADVTFRQRRRYGRKWGSLVCISIESIGRFAKLQRAHHHPAISLKHISTSFLSAYNLPSNLNGDLRPTTIGNGVFSGYFTWFEFEIWIASIAVYLSFYIYTLSAPIRNIRVKKKPPKLTDLEVGFLWTLQICAAIKAANFNLLYLLLYQHISLFPLRCITICICLYRCVCVCEIRMYLILSARLSSVLQRPNSLSAKQKQNEYIEEKRERKREWKKERMKEKWQVLRVCSKLAINLISNANGPLRNWTDKIGRRRRRRQRRRRRRRRRNVSQR